MYKNKGRFNCVFRMCPTMIRRCAVTLVAIEFPHLREQLATLMAHSLTTAQQWYNMAIRDQEVL